MNKKIQLKDLDGNVYPLTLDTCILKSNEGEIYQGQRISLSQCRCEYEEVAQLTRHIANGSMQGLLYHDNELYQFYDGGGVDVYDSTTYEWKRSFTIPNMSSVHFGGVDWYNESTKILVTHNASNNSLYFVNISDEDSITVSTVPTPDIPSDVIAHEGIVCCDTLNERIYLTGYTHATSNPSSERTGCVIYKINPVTGDASKICEMRPFHLQDSKFYNGRIFYANDRTTASGSGYNILRIVVVSPFYGIVSAITISGITGLEAEGICVASESILITATANHNAARMWKVRAQ